MTYAIPIINTDLKKPTLGITDLGYDIVGGEIQIYLEVIQFAVTHVKVKAQFNRNSYIKTLKMTYLAIDNTFTPAFSMNRFFPVLYL